jgi:hypothetical protein
LINKLIDVVNTNLPRLTYLDTLPEEAEKATPVAALPIAPPVLSMPIVCPDEINSDCAGDDEEQTKGNVGGGGNFESGNAENVKTEEKKDELQKPQDEKMKKDFKEKGIRKCINWKKISTEAKCFGQIYIFYL